MIHVLSLKADPHERALVTFSRLLPVWFLAVPQGRPLAYTYSLVLQIEPVYSNGHPPYRTFLRKYLASQQAAPVRMANRPETRLQAYYNRPHMVSHGTKSTRPW